MKSNETTPDDDHDRWPNDEAVEEGLRGLPSIDVPCELEDKLIAAIPGFVSVSNRERISLTYKRWIGMTAAAALIILACVFLYLPKREDAEGSPKPTVAGNQTAVYVTIAESKETDPCNILPPLSGWRL